MTPRKIWPTEALASTFYEVAPYHDLYDHALRQTQTTGDNPMKRMRHYGVQQAVSATRRAEGNAIEIGCLRGLSAWLACDAFRKQNRKLTFHVVDSFEGLSETTGRDRLPAHVTAAKINAKLKCDLNTVQRNLSAFDLVQFHKGWIPEPFAEMQREQFCYAHIDVDLYDPTLASLEFVWPRMTQGSVLLLDDYGTRLFPGARDAIDSFFRDKSDVVLYEQPAGQALAVKVMR